LIAIVFANLDSPLRFAELGKELLLPCIPFVTHSETRGDGTAGLIQPPSGIINWPVSSGVASASNQDYFAARRMPGG
jgi:hypothetical protein